MHTIRSLGGGGAGDFRSIWEFPKIRGAFLLRIIVYWALYRGPLILGSYHMLKGVSYPCFCSAIGALGADCMGPASEAEGAILRHNLNSLKGII